MNKSDLENLVTIRLSDAAILLNYKNFHGAYYLAGYAIECALKVCIAKQVRQHDFPNKKLAEDSYSHDLEKLLGVAGLKPHLANKEKMDTEFRVNWAVVKDWSEQARYDQNIEATKAQDLYTAITDKQSGVLEWLKTYW